MTKHLYPLLSLVLLFSTLSAKPCTAAELAGIKFEESIERDGVALTLNGLGIRKATFFRISVYVAALYLPQQNKAADKILCCTERKYLRMHFLRDVDVEKIRKGWSDGFENNIESLGPLKPKIKAFNLLMKSVKEGQVLSLDITSSSVRVELDGTQLGTIEGENFSKAVLSIWLGKSPPNDELKDGLLGL
jgi:hypothetical protein